MIPWVTVETLTPGVMSVATVGDEQRGFASLQRVVQRTLAKLPALHGLVATHDVVDIIHAARRRAGDVDVRIPTTGETYTLAARGIGGPAGIAHGVQFWIGPVARIPEPRPAYGLLWDLNTQTIQTPRSPVVVTSPTRTDRFPRISVAEMFHMATTFDRHDEVLDLLYQLPPSSQLQFDMTITHSTGRKMRWRSTIRTPPDTSDRRANWLVEEVTSAVAPPREPTIEQLGLREGLRRAGIHLAVVQLPHTSISYWLTEPAPWIRWHHLCRAADVFHPTDRRRLTAVGEPISRGHTRTLTMRTLNHQGGYSPTQLSLYACPDRSPRMAICEFSAAGRAATPSSMGNGSRDRSAGSAVTVSSSRSG